eukprot:scaffold164764_cov22-Tisochrysis_lutea.AAC.1
MDCSAVHPPKQGSIKTMAQRASPAALVHGGQPGLRVRTGCASVWGDVKCVAHVHGFCQLNSHKSTSGPSCKPLWLSTCTHVAFYAHTLLVLHAHTPCPTC